MLVKNLSFQHKKSAPFFFKGLSFALEKGFMHALHGKNGIGKSVLLQLLSKNISSEAIISGEIISEKTALLNQRYDECLVGSFSFFENSLFSTLPRFPNPLLPLKLPAEVLDAQLLKRFHIDPSIPVNQLSGGQRQILALLMKLQAKPKVLLLDEPTATLDQENANMVFEFLTMLKETTILVVCHDTELIHRFTTGQHLHMQIDSEGVRYLQ